MQNVRAVEKVDDAVQYEKIGDNKRIDVFDASVFATVRMLIDTDRSTANAGWFEDGPDVSGSNTGEERPQRSRWRST